MKCWALGGWMLFFVLFVAGCISQEALPDPLADQTELRGSWIDKTQPERILAVKLTPRDDTVWSVALSEDFVKHPVMIPGSTLTIHEGRILCHYIKNAYGPHEKPYNYLFYRYEMDGPDRFRLYALEYETMKKFIDSGEIEGSASETTWGANFTIDATPEETLKFLQRDDIWQLVHQLERTTEF